MLSQCQLVAENNMKYLLLLVILTICSVSTALESYKFSYKTDSKLVIVVSAETYEDAFKRASKQCFKTLTKGIYPSEEKGLEYIDICANPR